MPAQILVEHQDSFWVLTRSCGSKRTKSALRNDLPTVLTAGVGDFARKRDRLEYGLGVVRPRIGSPVGRTYGCFGTVGEDPGLRLSQGLTR